MSKILFCIILIYKNTLFYGIILLNIKIKGVDFMKLFKSKLIALLISLTFLTNSAIPVYISTINFIQ